MEFLPIIIILLFIIFLFGKLIIFGFRDKVNKESANVYNYALQKCLNSGMSQQDSSEIAKKYADDFYTECYRRRGTNGSMFNDIMSIAHIRDGFYQNIDARFR